MLLWRWATKCTPLEATAPGRTTRHSVRLTCMSLTQVCKETVLHQRLRWSELRQGKLDVKCLVGIGRVKLISINTLRCYHQEERGGCMSKKCLQVCSTVALYRWQLKPQAFRCGFLNTLSWLYRSFFFSVFYTNFLFHLLWKFYNFLMWLVCTCCCGNMKRSVETKNLDRDPFGWLKWKGGCVIYCQRSYSCHLLCAPSFWCVFYNSACCLLRFLLYLV